MKRFIFWAVSLFFYGFLGSSFYGSEAKAEFPFFPVPSSEVFIQWSPAEPTEKTFEVLVVATKTSQNIPSDFAGFLALPVKNFALVLPKFSKSFSSSSFSSVNVRLYRLKTGLSPPAILS